jgi:hypothetical protein
MPKPGMVVTTRLKPCPCPNCGYGLDAATAAFEDVRPKPGDLTVCIKCAALLEFTDGMGYAPANTLQLSLDTLEQLAEVQAAARKMQHQEKKADA